MVEGDPYNSVKANRSKQRLQKLGFFENIELTNKKTSELDKVDIEVDVEEKSTGSINFAVGYNTQDGPLGSARINERNFLGKGQNVSLGVSKADRSTDAFF